MPAHPAGSCIRSNLFSFVMNKSDSCQPKLRRPHTTALSKPTSARSKHQPALASASPRSAAHICPKPAHACPVYCPNCPDTTSTALSEQDLPGASTCASPVYCPNCPDTASTTRSDKDLPEASTSPGRDTYNVLGACPACSHCGPTNQEYASPVQTCPGGRSRSRYPRQARCMCPSNRHEWISTRYKSRHEWIFARYHTQ